MPNGADGDYIEGVAGTISANSLVGSMTANTDYYVRWIAFATFGGGQSSIGVTGSISGAQS
jgi:hypothetical protein